MTILPNHALERTWDSAGAPPAAITIERVEGDLGWELTQVYGLTETSPFIAICEERRNTSNSHHNNGRLSRRDKALS